MLHARVGAAQHRRQPGPGVPEVAAPQLQAAVAAPRRGSRSPAGARVRPGRRCRTWPAPPRSPARPGGAWPRPRSSGNVTGIRPCPAGLTYRSQAAASSRGPGPVTACSGMAGSASSGTSPRTSARPAPSRVTVAGNDRVALPPWRASTSSAPAGTGTSGASRRTPAGPASRGAGTRPARVDQPPRAPARSRPIRRRTARSPQWNAASLAGVRSTPTCRWRPTQLGRTCTPGRGSRNPGRPASPRAGLCSRAGRHTPCPRTRMKQSQSPVSQRPATRNQRELISHRNPAQV